jgi:hypothetical protein
MRNPSPIPTRAPETPDANTSDRRVGCRRIIHAITATIAMMNGAFA